MKSLSATFTRFGGVMLLPVILALVAFVLIGRPSSWLTLTIAGLAMGMMIFLMASGLSLIFGIMRLVNLAHGLCARASARSHLARQRHCARQDEAVAQRRAGGLRRTPDYLSMSAVRATTSRIVSRFSWLAPMSRKASSSAPAAS